MVKDIKEKRSAIYEMANLKPAKTGQPFELWVDELGKNRKTSHNLPRFKAKANGIELDIIIMPEHKAKIINADQQKVQKFRYSKEAIKFIEKFQQPLIMHWNGEIDSYDLLSIIMFANKTNCTVDSAVKHVLNDF